MRKREGGGVRVCLRKRDEVRLMRNLGGFKFKTNSLSTAGMKQNSFHRMSKVKNDKNSRCKENVNVEFTTCQKILECISP